MRMISIGFLIIAAAFGQDTGAQKADRWSALRFLAGTWEAKTEGATAASASGIYTFQLELRDHVMARHSSNDPGCKGPATFDCEHGDLLYIYENSPGEPLKAIYFDNEGHVIHYNVSTPAPNLVIFQSEPSPGPQFRLVYQRKNAVMTGKFQMQMPGKAEWTSYLEWAGSKK